MAAKKVKPKTKNKKPKGGKPGNQNARKHGLYAKNQPKASTKEKPVDVSGPERRRAIMDDVIESLYTKFNTLNDIDQITKCANSLSLAVTAANGCDRTIAIVSGKLTNLTAAIEQLFMEEDADDPRTIE